MPAVFLRDCAPGSPSHQIVCASDRSLHAGKTMAEMEQDLAAADELSESRQTPTTSKPAKTEPQKEEQRNAPPQERAVAETAATAMQTDTAEVEPAPVQRSAPAVGTAAAPRQGRKAARCDALPAHKFFFLMWMSGIACVLSDGSSPKCVCNARTQRPGLQLRNLSRGLSSPSSTGLLRRRSLASIGSPGRRDRLR